MNVSVRARYLSAMSEDAHAPRHQTQLPVLLLQASWEVSSWQGSEGSVRVSMRPSVTPLKPPDRNRVPSRAAMARDTEWFTASPTPEPEATAREWRWRRQQR